MFKKLVPLFIVISFLIPSAAFAATGTGACSGHDGVNCAVGPDTDGSVICNDEWTGSSVDYKDLRDVCSADFHPFNDLVEDHNNYEAIISLYETGIIQGYEDGTFQPEKTVNRAELLKILIGGKGITPTVEEYNNCFPDVTDDWYAPWVCYAKAQEWVEGYEDGTFQPAREVNKAEAIKMLMETQEYLIPGALTPNTIFEDVASGEWYAIYIAGAKDMGLLEIESGMYYPAALKTRASVSENIYRAMVIAEEGLYSYNDYVPAITAITDVSECKSLTGMFEMEKCVKDIAVAAEDALICAEMEVSSTTLNSVENECYLEIAILSDDPNVCELLVEAKAETAPFRFGCYTGYSIYKVDVTYCESITDASMNTDCLRRVEVMETYPDVLTLDELINSTWKFIADRTNDQKYCEYITSSFDIVKCEALFSI